MINLLHGDCLELMKSIPDKSIDLVLTDPPYGTTACKWDNIIPFEPMWVELKRITKDNGAICLFGSEPFSSHLRLSNLKMFKYDWKFLKQKSSCGNFVHAKNAPLKTVEDVLVFSHGKINHENKTKNRMSYYPQGLIDCEIKSRSNRPSNNHKHSCKDRIGTYTQLKTNYPTCELRYKSDGKIHPTQKPVALLEYLIKTYTLEGETVLDFTMGSGSTGVAAKNLNRKFIGIEQDDKYFEIAKNRINA